MSYTLQINGTVIFLPFHFKFATKMSDSRTSEYLGRTLDDNKTLLLSFVWVDSIVNNFCCLGCWKENLPLILLLLILYQSYLIGVRFSILLNMPCLCVYVWYLLFSCLFSDFFFCKKFFFLYNLWCLWESNDIFHHLHSFIVRVSMVVNWKRQPRFIDWKFRNMIWQ